MSKRYDKIMGDIGGLYYDIDTLYGNIDKVNRNVRIAKLIAVIALFVSTVVFIYVAIENHPLYFGSDPDHGSCRILDAVMGSVLLWLFIALAVLVLYGTWRLIDDYINSK